MYSGLVPDYLVKGPATLVYCLASLCIGCIFTVEFPITLHFLLVCCVCQWLYVGGIPVSSPDNPKSMSIESTSVGVRMFDNDFGVGAGRILW